MSRPGIGSEWPFFKCSDAYGPTSEKAPGSHRMVLRKGPLPAPFLGCSEFPLCRRSITLSEATALVGVLADGEPDLPPVFGMLRLLGAILWVEAVLPGMDKVYRDGLTALSALLYEHEPPAVAASSAMRSAKDVVRLDDDDIR